MLFILISSLIVVFLFSVSLVYCDKIKDVIRAKYFGTPLPVCRVIKDHHISIELSDGVKLSANVYRPSSTGTFPAILVRTPYSKDSIVHQYEKFAKLFASQGFVFIVQDVRGKTPSEGEFYPHKHEAEDGKDTIDWVVQQPWSDGQVALIGFSYLGLTAWQAAGASQAVCTLIPLFSSSQAFRCWYEEENVPHLKLLLFWMCKHGGSCIRQISHAHVDAQLAKKLNLETLDSCVIGEPILAYRDVLNHPKDDEFWRQMSVSPLELPCDIPVLLESGWYDQFLKATINDFQALKMAPEGSLKRESCLIIGPWRHNPTQNIDVLKLGKDAKFIRQFSIMLQWFKKWMKSDHLELPPVTYYLMGRNEWRTALSWPPQEVISQRFYLTDTPEGLNKEVVNFGQMELSFVPSDLVPSIGGRHLYSDGKDGPCDQSFLLDRKDVLIWSSALLEEEMTVAGPVNLHLHLVTSLPTVDLNVKLIDHFPDGTMRLITNGSHRVKKDSMDSVDIVMMDTAYVFSPGHRIEVALTHSDFPALAPNKEILDLSEASLSILTGPNRSYVEFFMIPKEGDPSHG